jgi:two-component system sensor histidine kinase TctE
VIILFAIAIFGLLIATRRALRPLDALSAQVARRSLDDLPPLDTHSAPEEVGELVEAINRLFSRLRDAALAQSAFLADAAHQLRTPLTQLRTESELSLLQAHPASFAPTLTRLAAASARTARLAEQLLSLARSDASASGATPAEHFDLRVIADGLARETAHRALDRGVDLGFELQSAMVHGRPHLVRELLNNLVDNAIVHGGSGTRITVRTWREAGTAMIEVEDDGPGIPTADRDRVFERFARGSNAQPEGSGLGLSIVRQIAHAHGATVALADPERGRGLTVRVGFPAVPA